MINTALKSWESQHERMKRMYVRLSNSYTSSVDYLDDLGHFFQDCWHLKDWIKNDPSKKFTSTDRDKIETEVNKHSALVIAGDLATGCKHFELDRNRSQTTEGAEVASMALSMANTGGLAEIQYVIHCDNDVTLSDKEVAKNAMDAWGIVLRDLGLT